MRGFDHLQDILDGLPPDDPTCRNAYCGWWERNNGVYEPHRADHEHQCAEDLHYYGDACLGGHGELADIEAAEAAHIDGGDV